MLLKKEMKRGCRASLISAMWHGFLLKICCMAPGWPPPSWLPLCRPAAERQRDRRDSSGVRIELVGIRAGEPAAETH